MPTHLRANQYEIAEPDGEGLVFGTVDTGYLTLDRPTHGSGEARTADTSGGEDGIVFARDFLGGKSVTFTIGVITDHLSDPHGTNLDHLEALEGWWTSPRWRESATSVAMLRACESESGGVWRAYGRPRRYDEAAGRITRSGYTPVACDFQMLNGLWYSDEEHVVDVTMNASVDGGLVAPLVAPLTTTAEASSRFRAVVGGRRPTPVVVEFRGPVTSPSLTIGSLFVGLQGTLAYDQVVTIDPRPWVRTVLREPDRAPVAGMLARGTPTMDQILLPPGAHTVEFKGRDDTGTARARLRWRDARVRPR